MTTRPQTETTSAEAGTSQPSPAVLTVNSGSSSLKLALFGLEGHRPRRILSARAESIGRPDAQVKLQRCDQQNFTAIPCEVRGHADALTTLLERLARSPGWTAPHALAHRVVHGGPDYRHPHGLSPELIDQLRRLEPYDPEHLPAALACIEAAQRSFPGQPQIACFDTGFHQHMPAVARLVPLPRRFAAAGVQRYGFHGLSYEYLTEELARSNGGTPARAVLAHLGSGASLAAVRQGVSIDTTMGFTPAAGVPMGTRAGDLDPGLFWYLVHRHQIAPETFNFIVNRQSGLLGISETSSDTRELLAVEKEDERAAEALAFFCYQIRKSIGALTAALEGLDCLVFSGGIGENSPEIRARICSGLSFLGVRLEPSRNLAGAPVISAEGSPVSVRVIPTDEELILARAGYHFLHHEKARIS